MDRFIQGGRNEAKEIRLGKKRTAEHLVDIEDLAQSGEADATTPSGEDIEAMLAACLDDLADDEDEDEDKEKDNALEQERLHALYNDDATPGDAPEPVDVPIDWNAAKNTAPGTLLPLDVRMRKARKIFTNSPDHKVIDGEDGRQWLMDTRTDAYVGKIVDKPRGGRYVYDPLTHQPLIYTREDVENTIFYKELREDAVKLPGVCPANKVDTGEEYFLFNFNGFQAGVYKLGGATRERYQVTLTGTDAYGRTVALHAMDYWPKVTVRAPTTWKYSSPRELDKLASGLMEDLNRALVSRASGDGGHNRGMGWRVGRSFSKYKPSNTPPCLSYRVEMDGRDLIGAEFADDQRRDFIEISLCHSGYVSEAIKLLMNPEEAVWPSDASSGGGGYSRPVQPSSYAAASAAASAPAPPQGWFKGTLPCEEEAHDFSFAGWTPFGFHLYNTVMGEAAFITSRNLPTGWIRARASAVTAVPVADRVTLHEGEFTCGVAALEVAPSDYLSVMGGKVERANARIAALRRRRAEGEEGEDGDVDMDEGDDTGGEAAPLVKDCRVTCFDFEMDPDEESRFPKPHSRVVTKMCAVTSRYSSAGEQRSAVTFNLGPMATREEMIDGMDFEETSVDRKFDAMGRIFHYDIEDEKAMLEDFVAYFVAVQPTMISAYNMGFDIVYLHNRLMVLGSGAFQALTLFPGNEPYYNQRNVKGASRFTLAAPGIPAIDMCYEVKMISKLPDYRLDTVGRAFTKSKRGKEDMDPARMHSAFRSRVGNYRLGYYCIVDAYLMLDIESVRPVLRMAIDNAYALSNTIGQMATRGNSHCYIQFYMYVAAHTPSITTALDGSGRIRKVYLPHSVTGARGDIEGGYVCDSPNSVFINGMTNTLDFNSLYPSNMNENNLCPTMAVSPKRIAERKLIEDRDFSRQPKYATLDDDEGTPERRAKEGYAEGENLRRLPFEEGTGFLKSSIYGDGVVRAIVVGLGARRTAEKGLMAKCKRAVKTADRELAILRADVSGTDHSSANEVLEMTVARESARASMHNITQNVLKTIMNTLYGILAACFGQIPFPAAAAAITAYGRWYVNLLREYLLKRHTLAPRWHLGSPTANVELLDADVTSTGQHILGVTSPYNKERFDFVNAVTYGDTDSIMYTPIRRLRRYWYLDKHTGRRYLRWGMAPRAEHHAWTTSISAPLADELNEYFARPTACVYDPVKKQFFGSVLAGGGATNGIIKVKAEKTCCCAYYLTKKRYVWIITETESGACIMSFSASGVQCTRRETPPSFKHAQAAILWYIINGAWDRAIEVAHELLIRIQTYRIPAYELASSVTISKDPSEYAQVSPAIAALVREAERSQQRAQVGVRHRLICVHGQDSTAKREHLPRSRIKKRDYAEIIPYVNTTRQQPHAGIYAQKAWNLLEPTLSVLFGGDGRATAKAACPKGTTWARAPIKKRKRKEDSKKASLSIKMPIRLDVMNRVMRGEREYFRRRKSRWDAESAGKRRRGTVQTESEMADDDEGDTVMDEVVSTRAGHVTVVVARTILDSFAARHNRRCTACKEKVELVDIEFHYGRAWRQRVAEWKDSGTSTPFSHHTKPIIYCGRCLASGAYSAALLFAQEQAAAAEAVREETFAKCRDCVRDTAMSTDDVFESYRACTQQYCPDYNNRNREGLDAFMKQTHVANFPPMMISH